MLESLTLGASPASNRLPPPALSRCSWSAAASSAVDVGDQGCAAPVGHILVVDDDPAIRRLIVLLLQSAGYRAGCAGDGEAGWDALCAECFDLLIVDHEMPKLTGLELLRRVRTRSLPLPAIMISGFMPWDEPDLESLLRPGAMMPKPFSFSALLENVKELLAWSPAGWPTASRDDSRPSLLTTSGQLRSF